MYFGVQSFSFGKIVGVQDLSWIPNLVNSKNLFSMEKNNMSWVTQAFIAMISISVMVLIIKGLTRLGLSSEVIAFYYFLFTTPLLFIFALYKKAEFGLPLASLPLFFLFAIIAVAYNYFNVSSVGSAPNVGYAVGIISFNVAVVFVASIFLFDASFTLVKFIGIIFSIIGIVLISL